MSETKTDEQVKIGIMNWLEGKTKEQTADKIIEVMEASHDYTVKVYDLDLRKQLFKAICQPIESPKTKWHGLW